MTEDRQRQLAIFGYIASVVSISFLGLGTILDPKFTWRSRSLSSIGEATDTSVFALTSMDQLAFNLFNGGLLLSALLGVPFLVVLYRDAKTRAERAGVGMLSVTLAANVGVAIAYLDGPYASLHSLAALAAFFGIGLTIWIYTTGAIQRSNADRGLGFMWVANCYALAWVLWILSQGLVFTNSDESVYFAVPEFVGAIVLASWIVAQARRIRSADTAV